MGGGREGVEERLEDAVVGRGSSTVMTAEMRGGREMVQTEVRMAVGTFVWRSIQLTQRLTSVHSAVTTRPSGRHREPGDARGGDGEEAQQKQRKRDRGREREREGPSEEC